MFLKRILRCGLLEVARFDWGKSWEIIRLMTSIVELLIKMSNWKGMNRTVSFLYAANIHRHADVTNDHNTLTPSILLNIKLKQCSNNKTEVNHHKITENTTIFIVAWLVETAQKNTNHLCDSEERSMKSVFFAKLKRIWCIICNKSLFHCGSIFSKSIGTFIAKQVLASCKWFWMYSFFISYSHLCHQRECHW